MPLQALEEELLAYADSHRDELYSLLSRLVRFDSQNFVTSGREYLCAQFIRGQYERLGLETELYSPDAVPGISAHPGYLPGRGLADRPNVSGVLRGAEAELSVMLAAHIDTMPVGDPDRWTADPFGGEIKDGRIYGLGSGDNKFGIAGGIFAVKALRALNIHLKKSIVLTSYVDEEYGGGDGALAACLKYPCKVYVNLDGGNFEMWTASLGGCGYSVRVRTIAPTDTAAPVMRGLCRLEAELERFAARRRAELHQNPLYAGTDMQRSAYRLLEFGCGSFGSNLDCGSLKFIFYTTRGKDAIEKELHGILLKLRPLLARQGLEVGEFEPTTRFFGYHEMRNKTGAVDLMKMAAEQVSGAPIRTTGACLSDLSIFLPYGSPESFSFGILRDFALPGGAHQPDEYVDCAQFLNHTKAMMLFLLRYCGVKD